MTEPYTDAGGMFHPTQVNVERGARISGERTVRFDVCVIGTGAGGAPVAKELAEGGMRVAMIEEGERVTPDDFHARPREGTIALYRDAGQIATLGNVPIVLPLGRTVGGSTTVNSATCFRTPDPVLDLWAREFGLESLTPDELDPFFRRVEREINIVQVPPELAGNNALVVKRGADRLGWSGDFIFRNVRGCVGSGVCTFGCPTGAKQHTGVTYVPKAWAAGAVTFSGCRAERIVTDGGRARAVEARTRGGGRLRIECDTVVVACGAIHTPLFLRRQGIAAPDLGRNLAIHPATAVRALFDEQIDMARGVPQSYYVDEFADERIMFEGAAGPPDYAAMSFPFSRERHRELMLSYTSMSQFGLMVSDTSRGFVRERGGRVEIRYDLNRDDVAAFKRGIERLVELYWAAGAVRVFPPLDAIGELRDGDVETVRKHDVRAHELLLMAFHPLGTARMDARAGHGVLDEHGAVRGVEGVYVSDAAAVPTSLGVNPQETIMALATRLAFHLLGAPAPEHEPEPAGYARPRIGTAHAAAV